MMAPTSLSSGKNSSSAYFVSFQKNGAVLPSGASDVTLARIDRTRLRAPVGKMPKMLVMRSTGEFLQGRRYAITSGEGTGRKQGLTKTVD